MLRNSFNGFPSSSKRFFVVLFVFPIPLSSYLLNIDSPLIAWFSSVIWQGKLDWKKSLLTRWLQNSSFIRFIIFHAFELEEFWRSGDGYTSVLVVVKIKYVDRSSAYDCFRFTFRLFGDYHFRVCSVIDIDQITCDVNSPPPSLFRFFFS